MSVAKWRTVHLRLARAHSVGHRSSWTTLPTSPRPSPPTPIFNPLCPPNPTDQLRTRISSRGKVKSEQNLPGGWPDERGRSFIYTVVGGVWRVRTTKDALCSGIFVRWLGSVLCGWALTTHQRGFSPQTAKEPLTLITSQRWECSRHTPLSLSLRQNKIQPRKPEFESLNSFFS